MKRKVLKGLFITMAIFVFLSFMGCAKILEDMSTADGPHDMDWFCRNHGYVVMGVNDISGMPVMKITGIPLNSEALLPFVLDMKDDDLLYFFKSYIKHQQPVFYITIYSYSECVLSWPALRLKQGQGYAYPRTVVALQVPIDRRTESGTLVATTADTREWVAYAGSLFRQYGEQRVRGRENVVGVFTNPYTGRSELGLSKEIEMLPGEILSAVVVFSGGLRLNQPFRFLFSSRRYLLSNGKMYTTRENSQLVKMFIPEGQKLPGENIYKYGEGRTGQKYGRLREREEERQD